jgi:hypothetical protein
MSASSSTTIKSPSALAHPYLHALLDQLHVVHSSIANYAPAPAHLPILDASGQLALLPPPPVRGLAALRAAAARELTVLEKVRIPIRLARTAPPNHS